jgi:uncharacterized protein YdiU (UPF0061 family)
MSTANWPTFHNSFFGALPQEAGSPTPSRLTPGVMSTCVHPTPVSKPELLIASREVATLLGLPAPDTESERYAQIFSGNELPPQSVPFATRYGGHQFGHWAGQLGDGRAISLGEITHSKTETWEVQLKGAGPTPYSRRADGRAVLRSSLREYLCSEAMAHLGIPTTRALCCVTTGDAVVRDLFYDGNPEPEPGAITTRVAPSFLRFGHFEILATSGETDNLRALLQRTIDVHFPTHSAESAFDITRWFQEVCSRTIFLMTEWLRVGFVHGVMNTDNMSILGLTIDFGPYGWLDQYDPLWTPNTTDAERKRYRFGNQPSIALWNLSRLAEALLPLFESEQEGIDQLKPILDHYGIQFRVRYLEMLSRKLGVSTLETPEGLTLVEELEKLLTQCEVDPTLFYRLLSKVDLGSETTAALQLQESFYSEELYIKNAERLITWLKNYRQIRNQDVLPPAEQLKRMNAANPVFILRNYIVQEALDELAQGKRSLLDAIHEALKTPYEETELTLRWFKKRPDWAKSRPGCSALSCSS